MLKNKIIAASILAADFSRLGDEVRAVVAAGSTCIHFDVMDHHFVPNLSFGAVICESLRKAGITVPIDVHLMVDNPEAYIEPFAAAGANILTFHPETVSDVNAVVNKIKKSGMGAGLAFNPDKPVNVSIELAAQLEMILLMSVFPGFGGQSFIPDVFDKIKQTRTWLDANNLNLKLAIDGGVKINNLAEISAAGADFFVVGSGLFAAKNYSECIKQMYAEIEVK